MAEEPVILDEKAREAIHAATDAAHAVEVVRQTQLEAAAEMASQKAAALAAEKISDRIVDENRMGELMRENVRYVLSRGSEDDREMILAKVPYICKSIEKIEETLGKLDAKMDEMKDKFDERIKDERMVSNKNYAPILAWTILLGILGIFGLAIASNIAKFFVPPVTQQNETTK